MDHKIVHIEISTTDGAALSKFYADLFGWEVEHIDALNYSTFRAGDGIGGGFNLVTENNPVGTIIVYIETDDVTATLHEVENAGGIILVPETDIPNTGKFGLFRDPQGNTMGLFMPYPMP